MSDAAPSAATEAAETPQPTPLEAAEAEVAKLREELAIYKDRVEGEKAIVAKIRITEADLEGAKAEVSAAKERLAAAHKEMVEFLSREPGRQQQIPFEAKPADDGALTWFEQGGSAYSQGRHIDACALPVGEAERAEWERGWRLARSLACGGGELDSSALAHQVGAVTDAADQLPVGEKPPVDIPVVEHLDRHWLIYRGATTPEGATRFVLVQLYSKDEWMQLHADAYGNPVTGFDQDNGARDRRQRGGIDCGRTVAVGRKKLIVGPLSDACWIDIGGKGSSSTGSDTAA